jgi:Tfp pilus assembly protein PilX
MSMTKLRRRKALVNTTMPAATPRERRGFALPMAILIIAFLTVTIAAAYSATSSEQMTNLAQRGESKAYMVAQAGLENFMARRNETGFCAWCDQPSAPPTAAYESTTVALPGGYADVTATRIRTATNSRPAIYLLRAHGVDTSSLALAGSTIDKATGKNRSLGERTVAQLVYWNVNQVNVLSGWTSTSGLDKQGSSGTISGVDACGKKPAVAGIAVPDGDYGVNGNFTPAGNPPVQYLGSQQAANDAVKIDWDGVINGNRIQADYTFASAGAAAAAWSSIAWETNGVKNYPVIRVNDNFTLPTQGGQGTLIVMGNLTMSGDNLWKGILLVGGQMTSNGNGTVSGATMSGLNTMFTDEQIQKAKAQVAPGAVSSIVKNPANATANGTKTFQYDSCEVAKAAGGLATYSVYPNAWMDNFVTY